MSAPNEEKFIITLPSNVPEASAIGNRPSRYETRLARPMRLDGAWEAALINFTYPHEWTCLKRDYRFTIAFPAPGEKQYGSAGTDLEWKQPLEYLNWHTQLSEEDLHLPDKNIARRLLHFNNNTVNWHFSDEALFAADYTTPYELCAGLESMINRVLRRVHNDPGVRVMLTASSPPRINIVAPRVKFVIIALTNESIIRALGYNPATYLSERVLEGESVDYLFCENDHTDESIAERLPSVRVLKDIYVYTDIVQPSLVSNSLANLIDMVPVTGSVEDISVHRPSHPHFVRLLGGDLSCIEIRLCQEDGQELPISTGDVLVQLQIRRVQMSRI